jgi:small subunit ribosomal protein S17
MAAEKLEKIGRGKRKIFTGKVVSTAMEKSAVVEVQTAVKMTKYKKAARVRKKFIVHDENNGCNVGDTVRIAETRPLSKRKCWCLVEIVERAK